MGGVEGLEGWDRRWEHQLEKGVAGIQVRNHAQSQAATAGGRLSRRWDLESGQALQVKEWVASVGTLSLNLKHVNLPLAFVMGSSGATKGPST